MYWINIVNIVNRILISKGVQSLLSHTPLKSKHRYKFKARWANQKLKVNHLLLKNNDWKIQREVTTSLSPPPLSKPSLYVEFRIKTRYTRWFHTPNNYIYYIIRMYVIDTSSMQTNCAVIGSLIIRALTHQCILKFLFFNKVE